MATNWSEGTPWGNKKDPANWDIVDKELNRYQPAFEHVQRYPEGYGGQPTKPTGGSTGGSTGGGFGGGGPDWDRLIGAIEKGVQGWGSNASASTAPVSNTNTFNPVFNPTISMTGPNTQVAGGDIKESPISTETVTTGGGPTTAGRDTNLSGGGAVDTGAGGGSNVVDAGPKSISEQVDTFTGTDTTPPPTNGGGGGGITGPDLTGPDPNAGGGLNGGDGGLGAGGDGRGGLGTGGDDGLNGGGEGGLNGGGEENNLTIDGSSFLKDQLIQATNEQTADTLQHLDNAGLTFIDPFAKEGETMGDRHANLIFQPGIGSGAEGLIGGEKGVIDTDFEGAIDITGHPSLSPASAETEAFLSSLGETGGGTQNANTTINANTSASTGDNTMTAGGDIIGSTQDNTAIATGGVNIAGGNVNLSGGGDISTVGGGGNVVNANLGNQSGGQDLSATTNLPSPSAYDQLSDNEKYITDLFVEGLNRAPESEGMEYFLNELESGSLEAGSSLDATIFGSAEAELKDDLGITEGVYQSIDDYMAAGGKGGNPSASNYIQQSTPEKNPLATDWDLYERQQLPLDHPDNPFYVDPNFDWNDPQNNPFAEQNAQLQQEQAQLQEQKQADLDDLQAKADAAGGWWNLENQDDRIAAHQKLVLGNTDYEKPVVPTFAPFSW